MASSKERQRKLARAKLDRQMARRAATARRKRQIRAGIGTGLAVLLVALGTVWLFGGFSDDGSKDTAASDTCTWTPQNASGDANLTDVGTPPTKDVPTEGTRVMTVVTEGGDLTVELNTADSPCGTASLAHLAGKNFFDNTTCHELTGTFLRCGDKSGTGAGGPTYSFFGENVPSAPEGSPSAAPSATGSPAPATEPQYPRGTVALVATTPGNFGSQFVIFHKDLATTDPTYSIVGKVIGGLPVLDKIVKAGTVDNGSGAKVKPAKDVVVKELSVDDETGAGTPSPAAASPTASPTAQS